MRNCANCGQPIKGIEAPREARSEQKFCAACAAKFAVGIAPNVSADGSSLSENPTDPSPDGKPTPQEVVVSWNPQTKTGQIKNEK